MKTNGMRVDSAGGGMPLIGGSVGTPDSLTLSVDSLPQRQIYQGESHKASQATTTPTWRRSPIIDITNSNVRRIERPPQYALQQVIEVKIKNIYKSIQYCIVKKLVSVNSLSTLSLFTGTSTLCTCSSANCLSS